MDERLHELLSRQLDGDLTPAEEAELTFELEKDPELVAELESLRRLRLSTRELAVGMAPPAALDALVEPLRQGRPESPRKVRPIYRWLGAAAAIVLGASVAVEMLRRNPAPGPDRTRPPRHRVADPDTAIFELAPLPTANPDVRRPLGAADRLLEEDPPDVTSPEPVPLEVIGPVAGDPEEATPEHNPTGGSGEVTTGGREAPLRETKRGDRGQARTTTIGSGEGFAPAPPSHAGNIANADLARRSKGALRAGEDQVENESGKARIDQTESDARVMVGDVSVWTGRIPSCPVGIHEIMLGVSGGVVTTVQPVTQTGAGVDRGACRLDLLNGVAVDGLSDGVHPARVVIAGATPK